MTDNSQPLDGETLLLEEGILASRFRRLQEDIQEFIDQLPTRVPLFTSSTLEPDAPRLLPPSVPNPVKAAAAKILPFSLSDLDQDVKSDVKILTTLLSDSQTYIAQQLSYLRVAGYVLYTTSFVIPRRLMYHLPVRRVLLPLSEQILSTDYYRAAAASYLHGFKEMFFGDGGRKDLMTFQQLTRIQFGVLSQELASMRRDYEVEREERLSSQREIRKELESVLDQLRAQQVQSATPGRVS